MGGAGAGEGGAPPDRGPVEVLVLEQDLSGDPAAGIPVVFADPDGTIAANLLTGVDGKASAEVLPGGSVTVIREQVTSTLSEIYSRLAIEPL